MVKRDELLASVSGGARVKMPGVIMLSLDVRNSRLHRKKSDAENFLIGF